MGGEIVELFQNESLGLFVGKFAADLCEQLVGFCQAGYEGGLVFLQGSDFFFIFFLRSIEGSEFVRYLLQQQLVLGFKVVVT